MDIAEKLTIIAANQKDVYNAGFTAGQAQGGGGGDDYWQYVNALNNTFQNITFPEGTELVFNVQNLSGITSMISGSTGLTKLKIKGKTKAGTIGGTYSFMNGSILEIDLSELDNGIITFGSNIKYVFMDCARLKYIRGELNLSNVTSTLNMFRSVGQLIEVRFTAGSIKVDLSLSSAIRLSDDSIQSIIDGLADLTGQTAQTLTLTATAGAKLTDAQKSAISAKNWNVTY
jgi:hypothetical protein